jgi:hypothetical protein
MDRDEIKRFIEMLQQLNVQQQTGLLMTLEGLKLLIADKKTAI